MNKNTLKAAVKKYAPLLAEGKSEGDIIDAISADKKGYSEDDVLEILTAVNDQSGEEEEEPAKAEKVETKYAHKVYQEWKGEFVDGKFVPTRKLRDNVKLHDVNVEGLNANTSVGNPVAYLTAEEADALRH